MSARLTCLSAALLIGLASASSAAPPTAPAAPPAHNDSTCTGTWPSYWQDPTFDKTTMWEDQQVSDTPKSQHWDKSNPQYTNPAFRISDAFSTGRPDDPKTQKWRDKKFDALFKPDTPQDVKLKLAEEYGWDVMHYIQDGNISSGNINTDWDICANKHRHWYNMPFQTYNVLQGREFIHGLTREAPVTFSAKPGNTTLGTTVWAVGFYNGNAAPTLAKVWGANGVATVPKTDVAFHEGTVIGKLLFTTATDKDFAFLANMPRWTANISSGAPGASNPTYCTPPSNATMPQQSQQCPRAPAKVTLLQFDIGIRDARSPNGWVFGTFVADGEAKAAEKNPWNRISLLGLIYGNDTPPYGELAYAFPVNPQANGFKQGVVAWDVAARLNAAGGSYAPQQPGHLGCNSRLNGPADNNASSCFSCHMSASVPDKNNSTPPLIAQFTFNGNPLTPQCAPPDTPASKEVNGVTFAQMDSIYFAETKCGSPFNTVLPNGLCILGTNVPDYADKNPKWVATDFSLQMSGALVEWKEWVGDLAEDKLTLLAAKKGPKALARHVARTFTAHLPERGE